MARSRNIKPGFFTNEDLVELDFATRLLFAGLWTVADKCGRLQDRPKKIKIDVFPADNLDIEAMLSALHNGGFIVRYEVDGCKFIQVKNWDKHQNPHHTEKNSVIPPQSNVILTVTPPLKTVDTSLVDGGNPADSGFLIPDSPIPDSLKKTPRKRVTAKPVVEKPEDVCLQVWIDWCSLRKEKRAPVTVTVIDSARGEAAKAGMTFEDFLRVWCRRGSQGLEASWIKSNERPASKPAETFAERDDRNAKERYERITGRKHPDLLPQHLNIIEADPIVRIAA